MNPHRQVHVCSTSRVAALGGGEEEEDGRWRGEEGCGLEKVRVLEPCREACPGCCCFSQDSARASKTENR